MVTCPTPEMVSSRFLMTFSAMEESALISAVVLSTAMDTIGIALKSIRCRTGSFFDIARELGAGSH